MSLFQRILSTLVFIFIFSCDNSTSKSNARILPNSSGTINNISVVIENDDWQNIIGEAVRAALASPVLGLPQDEPLFSMSQIPPKVFSGFAKTHRSVIKIEQGNPGVKVFKDLFAKPQRVVLVSGNTAEEIASEIQANKDKIITVLKAEELVENQRRIKKSLFKTDNLETALGIDLDFPTAYRIAKEENGFFWIRKDITTGDTNLLIYELPHSAINRTKDSIVNQIIQMRDSIGRVHIPGPLEGTHLSTEMAYAPYVFDVIVDEKSAIETRGIWEVPGAFMGGPFLNYAIEDKVNKRWLIIEGFAYAPSVEKREHMFELEAIIKSIRFTNKS